MSCCGKRREQLRAPQPPRSRPQALTSRTAQPKVFEYVGTTGLTVVGAATGRRYRFDRPGARATVEAADAASLAAVPKLREVQPPSALPSEAKAAAQVGLPARKRLYRRKR